MRPDRCAMGSRVYGISLSAPYGRRALGDSCEDGRCMSGRRGFMTVPPLATCSEIHQLILAQFACKGLVRSSAGSRQLGTNPRFLQTRIAAAGDSVSGSGFTANHERLRFQSRRRAHTSRSWRWAFFLNLPVGSSVILAICLFLFLGKSRSGEGETRGWDGCRSQRP